MTWEDIVKEDNDPDRRIHRERQVYAGKSRNFDEILEEIKSEIAGIERINEEIKKVNVLLIIFER